MPVLLVFVVLFVLVAVVVGQEGVVVALFMVEERLYIFFCKNEAIFGWIVGKSFVFSEGGEPGGFPEVGQLLGAALFLELAELFERAFEAAGEAMPVRAQAGEGAHLGVEREVFVRVGEQRLFEAVHAVQVPGVACQGPDQLLFGGALGLVFVEE